MLGGHGQETRPAAAGHATSFRASPPSSGSNPPERDRPRQRAPPSSSNSQDSSTNDGDLIFTPPGSEGGMSPGNGSGHDSSQESQLLRLSQIAAAQARIPDTSAMDADGNGALSRKRMADGLVKHTRNQSSVSPVRVPGHSRNTSALSIASTASSRLGEVSAELKVRLSYAMVKVSHGWQSHSIDQVETLASQAASPTSSTSTVQLRNGSSASPQLSNVSHRGSNSTTPATGSQHQFPSRTADSLWRESPLSGSRGSSTSPVKPTHTLAPPVSIQPSRHLSNPRRNSNPRQPPAYLSSSHQSSPNTGPHTPGQPSPYLGIHFQRTPSADPMLFSPNQSVREQDAVESLLFMSSPGNSANLKHAFPSQTMPSSQPGTLRTALPTGPRKSLPSGRPTNHVRSQSHTQKRVGFEKSPREMEIDEPFGTPNSRATPRRKINGGFANGHIEATASRLKQIPVSSGLTVPFKPRPALRDEDIDRMLDRAAAEDSDSEGEIRIPIGRARREGANVIGA
ncbi:hypothetical protein B0T26DRAFT_643530 [Lasiosphaeria miniovina]|uniref:Cyclin-dependent kinase n=1 Tax=Lasiosphaeria miniovina TaxID=1954250 RepID=A0AA40E1D8_9PEZI|nr:uncharacterized protein B0T26DRAFT_643530 [Lasiosphaeria miniovina]KAK0723440.1 hypothetical protein B0T26DRAFT_643530 [Lasiosphaeria miniovina]